MVRRDGRQVERTVAARSVTCYISFIANDEIAELKTQLARLDERMNTKQAEYKTDIGNLAAEFRTDIGNLAEKMAQRDTRLLLWTMGIVTGVVAIGVAIIGILIRWPAAG